MMDKRVFPVIGHVSVENYGRLSILGLRMMSPEREKELGAKSADRWKRLQAS